MMGSWGALCSWWGALDGVKTEGGAQVLHRLRKRSPQWMSRRDSGPFALGPEAVQIGWEALTLGTRIFLHNGYLKKKNQFLVLKIVFGGFLHFSQVPSHFLYFCFKLGALSSFGFYQIIRCAKASISPTDGLNVHENTCLLKKLN